MEARKIFYMLTLCIALQPCAADALFEKWSTRALLSLSSVVLATAFVSVYLYCNWPRKAAPKEKQENNKKIKTVSNTKPADKQLQSLPKAAPKEAVSQPDFNAGDAAWVRFIHYKLSTLNDLEQQREYFNGPSFFKISNCRGMTGKIGFFLNGQDQMSLFNGMVHRGNLMSVNLLLLRGLVDFTAKYISIASDTKFASKLKYLMRLVVNADGRVAVYGDTNESAVNYMTTVLQSHGAKPFNNFVESTEIDVNDVHSDDKIQLEPLQSDQKQKLYFGYQYKPISETECVNQLNKLL